MVRVGNRFRMLIHVKIEVGSCNNQIKFIFIYFFKTLSRVPVIVVFRLGGRWSLGVKEEPITDFIKTEPQEHDTETGRKMSQEGLPAKKPLKKATETSASRKGKKIANTNKDMRGLKKSTNVPPSGKPPEQELVIVKPQVEPQSDLFADIFQNEKDLETLDSIVNVARQNSRVENDDDEESLVGVMSDEDDSSSSGVSDVVIVGDNDEGAVGIMSSSDESSRDGEDSCGDKRKDSSILGNNISHFGCFFTAI
jgi:hypothetical protein